MNFIWEVEDCKRIQGILERHNTEATLSECQDLWQDHSSKLCASWIILPESDEDIWEILEDVVLSQRKQ